MIETEWNGEEQYEEPVSDEEERLVEYRKSTRAEKLVNEEVGKFANEEQVEKIADDAPLTKPEVSSPPLKQCIAVEAENRGEHFEEYIPHIEDRVEEYQGSIQVENDKGVEKSVTEMGVKTPFNEKVAKELANEDGIDKRPSEEVVNTLANEDEIKQLLYNEVVGKVANEAEVEELPSDEVLDKLANKEGIEKIEKSCAVPMVIGVGDLEKSDEVTQSRYDYDLENLDTQLILEEEFEESIAAEKELRESTLIVKDKAREHGESTQAETENGEEEQHEFLAVLEDENEEYRESTPALEEKGGDEFIESPADVANKFEEVYKSTAAEKDNGCEEVDDSLAALNHKDEEYRESTPVENEEQIGRLANEDEVEELSPGEVVDKLANEEEVKTIEDSISVLKETLTSELENTTHFIQVDELKLQSKVEDLDNQAGLGKLKESCALSMLIGGT
ncbi:unnamed protein product [Orchesella dallaii]|uniref:Uncharacterized protein n=1 Tax=Orchesella dallaii TaxID=48710 RepID=A0ABP1PT86_9HEXA